MCFLTNYLIIHSFDFPFNGIWTFGQDFVPNYLCLRIFPHYRHFYDFSHIQTNRHSFFLIIGDISQLQSTNMSLHSLFIKKQLKDSNRTLMYWPKFPQKLEKDIYTSRSFDERKSPFGAKVPSTQHMVTRFGSEKIFRGKNIFLCSFLFERCFRQCSRIQLLMNANPFSQPLGVTCSFIRVMPTKCQKTLGERA